MAFNNLLDRKTDDFLRSKWSTVGLMNTFLRLTGKVEILEDKLEEFLKQFTDRVHLEYVLLRILNKVDGTNFTQENCKNYIEFSSHTFQIFESNKTRITDDLKFRLYNNGINLDKEMYTREEFEDLLSKIDKIAESIFAFQQKSDIANEIIYDSIDEIKEELKAQAEKGKIFGKEFVEQQLAGKIMDMAFKGSFFAMLSHAPEQISDIAGHVKGLL